jgi:hypothetical protein
MLWKVAASHEYVQWHSNKTAWMKGDIFEAWILQLNNQFKGQI